MSSNHDPSSGEHPAAPDPHAPYLPTTDGLSASERLAPVVILVILGLTYVATRCPVPCFGDPAELAVSAVELGLPHPTGYPVYVTLAAIWVRLLWFLSPATALHLGSVAAAIGALWALERCQRRLGATPVVRAGALALVGVTPAMWTSATVTEVYALHGTLAAGVFLMLAAVEAGTARRGLGSTAIVAGIATGVHMTSVMLAPAIAAWLFLRDRAGRATGSLAWKPWAKAAAGWTGGASLVVAGVVLLDRPARYNYLDQYLVEFPGAVPSGTLERAVWVLTGQQYSAVGGVLAMIRDGSWIRAFGGLTLRLAHEAGPLLALGSVGLALAAILNRDAPEPRPVAVAAAVVATLQLAFLTTYQHSFESAFFLQGWVALGLGAALLPGALRLRERSCRAYGLVLLLIASIGLGRQARAIDWSEATTRYHVTIESLDLLSPEAVVLATWADSTLLWYLTLVEGRRPDLIIVNASPASWERLAQSVADRPLYVTHRLQIRAEAEYSQAGIFLRWRPQFETIPRSILPPAPPDRAVGGLATTPVPDLS